MNLRTDRTVLAPTDPALQPWHGAATLAELGELTARYLDGRIERHPGDAAGFAVVTRPDPRIADVRPRLAAYSRAGLVPIWAQMAYQGPERDGACWTRVATLHALTTRALADRLAFNLTGTSCTVVVQSPAAGDRRRGIAVTVAVRDGEPIMTLGRPVPRRRLRDEIYPGLGRDAVDAAYDAAQILIYQGRTVPPPSDLWSVLDWAIRLR